MQYSIYTRMQVATPAVSLMIFTRITLALIADTNLVDFGHTLVRQYQTRFGLIGPHQ